MSGHDQGHHGSKKAILAAMAANLGIAVAKFVGFLLTRSASMLAESVHSVADTTNQVLLLVGAKRAAKPADAAHPFGYGREQYLFAGLVSMLLFSMGGMFALYEGFEKLTNPHGEEKGFMVAIVILVVAILLEGASLRTARNEVRPLLRGRSYLRFVRDAKSPELPIVLLEDSGAVLGLVLALCGVLLAHVTHDARWDGVGSLSIGVLLIAVALLLTVEVWRLLRGESVSQGELDEIRAAAESVAGVEFVGRVRGEHRSGHEQLLELKIKFVSTLTADEVARVTDEVEAAVRAKVPAAALIFVESWREQHHTASANT